ncbi:hypothetical protein D3C77_557830 [compost metagenome]
MLLGISHRCIKAGENAFGISLVIVNRRLDLGCAFAGFTLDGRGLLDTGIGVVRRVLGRCALALGYRLARGWCGFDARSWAVSQQVGEAQAQAMPACVWKLAAQGADRLRPVRRFSGTGEDDQCTLGLAGVGRLPEGEELVAASVQHLSFGLRNLPL